MRYVVVMLGHGLIQMAATHRSLPFLVLDETFLVLVLAHCHDQDQKDNDPYTHRLQCHLNYTYYDQLLVVMHACNEDHCGLVLMRDDSWY